MDVHSGFVGVSGEQLREAHERDLAIEKDEGVHFERAWMDPEAGKVFCLATGPSKEAVIRIHERAGHPTPEVYELTVEVVLNPDTFEPKLVNLRFKGVVHDNVHACHGRDWVDGDSHLRSRICANADIGGQSISGCMAHAAGPCEPGSYNPRPARCKLNDGAAVWGDGDFEGCDDSRGVHHPEPITVFLRSPCEDVDPKAQTTCGGTCDYSVSPPKCTDSCKLAKSPGQCLQTDACLKDPAACPAPPKQ